MSIASPPSLPAPTVFIVDDDPPVLDALDLLMRTEGYRAEAHPSAESFLEGYEAWRAAGGKVGCLVLDVRMPGMDGLELQQWLRERNMLLPIVFLTGHGDVPMAVRAIQAGALDFLLKPFANEALLERVARAFEHAASALDEAAERRDVERRLARLTPRERQVMERVVRGRVNREIAEELEVSQRTVELHRARVMQKTGATSLARLVRMTVLASR